MSDSDSSDDESFLSAPQNRKRKQQDTFLKSQYKKLQKQTQQREESEVIKQKIKEEEKEHKEARLEEKKREEERALEEIKFVEPDDDEPEFYFTTEQIVFPTPTNIRYPSLGKIDPGGAISITKLAQLCNKQTTGSKNALLSWLKRVEKSVGKSSLETVGIEPKSLAQVLLEIVAWPKANFKEIRMAAFRQLAKLTRNCVGILGSGDFENAFERCGVVKGERKRNAERKRESMDAAVDGIELVSAILNMSLQASPSSFKIQDFDSIFRCLLRLKLDSACDSVSDDSFFTLFDEEKFPDAVARTDALVKIAIDPAISSKAESHLRLLEKIPEEELRARMAYACLHFLITRNWPSELIHARPDKICSLLNDDEVLQMFQTVKLGKFTDVISNADLDAIIPPYGSLEGCERGLSKQAGGEDLNEFLNYIFYLVHFSYIASLAADKTEEDAESLVKIWENIRRVLTNPRTTQACVQNFVLRRLCSLVDLIMAVNMKSRMEFGD